jgi:hypothetical protein
MADTQRTRAALITLLADNVTGQISAQDLRDFLVTVMETEFAYVGDFWKGPDAQQLSSDKTTRGAHLYSQNVDDTCSFGNILMQNQSGSWSKALFSGAYTSIFRAAMAANSVTVASTEITLLAVGLVKNADMSNILSGQQMGGVWLISGTAGSIASAGPTSYGLMVGFPEPEGSGVTTSLTDVYRFDPQWAVAV